MLQQSNVRCIALSKIRITLNYLRKANIFAEEVDNENPLLAEFRELQNTIRYSMEEYELDYTQLVSPFALLLHMDNMTGPYKLIALESLMDFINFDVLVGVGSQVSEAISSIIDAVISCRFVQTDSSIDEMVQLRILQALHCIVINKTSVHLSEQSVWKVFEFCCASLLRNGANKVTAELYHEAEKTVLDLIKFLFEYDTGHISVSLCMSKLLQYLLHIINNYVSKMKVKNEAFVQTGSQRVTTNLSDQFTTSTEILHAMFALSTMQFILLTGYSLQHHVLQNLISKSADLRQILVDDVGLCLLSLLEHRGGDSSSLQVLQLALNIFMLLQSTIGPCNRILIECFTRQVFIKSLLQLVEKPLSEQLVQTGISDHTRASSATANRSPCLLSTFFQIDELELILECLCDLISDTSFVPSLFVSFDCDPTKPDVAIPLITSICSCASTFLKSGAESLGSYKEVGILTVQLYKHVVNAFNMRLHDYDKFKASMSKLQGNIVSTNSDAESTQISLSMRFKCGRAAKECLCQASKLFTEKAELGLKYLQNLGVLNETLSPAAVANFLRLSPDLPKDAVGAYLGELGKDDAKYDGNSKEFHAQVLLKYVSSFEFQGHGILDCLRIFLSAFRLPGEAQQIDRILVAFSEFCHAHSAEGQSGALENPEVTYLLSFSIIMLNTDCHNPNVRPDRKMTVDQFVRNNTNYGKEVHQTIPLNRTFLEGIFTSIASLPIRTQSRDMLNSVTNEVWTDMHLQAKVDPRKSVLISSGYSLDLINSLFQKRNDVSTTTTTVHDYSVSKSLQDSAISVSSLCIDDDKMLVVSTFIRRLLTEDSLAFGDPLVLCRAMSKVTWLVDADMLEILWKHILYVALAAHESNFKIISKKLNRSLSDKYKNNEFNYDNITIFGNTGNFLYLTRDFLLESLHVFRGHGLDYVLDLAVILFGGFSGLLDSAMTTSLMDFLHKNISSVDESSLNALKSLCNNNPLNRTSHLLHDLLIFPSMRAALFVLLQIIQKHQTKISCWPVVFQILGIMRDITLLPPQMVLDYEKDILPSNVRDEFEMSLRAIDLANVRSQRPNGISSKTTLSKSSASILSLQGLGEALFGGQTEQASDLNSHSLTEDECDQAELTKRTLDPMTRNNLISARFDKGYEHFTDYTILDNRTEHVVEIKDGLFNRKAITLDAYRKQIWSGSLQSLVSDTRFMTAERLKAFVSSLIGFLQNAQTDHKVDDLNSSFQETSIEFKAHIICAITSFEKVASSSESVSKASLAWFEMLLVEVSLRNRDRFGSLWPILAQHYIRTLSDPHFSSLSYVTERRVTGILKIAIRMISREHLSAEILSVLGILFSDSIISLFSDQVAAGMWALLTLNVDLLPQLPLDQWQIILGIMSKTAATNKFATFKSFEAMAWLLHEPRLMAKVPVFCIIAVRPLLLNVQAPVTVSVGAIHLLLLLHSRLEVLFDENETINHDQHEFVEEYNDATIIWESCWLPILRTLRDGVSDFRSEVQNASAEALFTAVLDRHSSFVPTSVLIEVIGEIIVSAVCRLKDCSIAVADNCLVDNVRSNGQSYLQENWMRVEMKESEVREREELDTVTKMQLFENNLPILGQFEKSIICLKTLFTKHLDRISVFPSFDQLWLRLLEFMGQLINVNSDGSNNSAHSIDGNMNIMDMVKNISKNLLRSLLILLASEGIFDMRQGLRLITIENIQHFDGCSQLTLETGIENIVVSSK